MPKLNIYVSDDLKKRMDKCRVDVNWSQTASNAFELKLGEIAAAKEKKAMTDVVQRLKATLVVEDAEMIAAGKPRGREWAENHATAKQLIRLAVYQNENAGDFSVAASNAYSAGECLAFAILGDDDDRDRHAAQDFWNEAGFDGVPDEKIAEGFARGALEVWQSVCDQV